MCVICEPQQTVTLTLSLAAAPQKESNIKFTYKHSKCSCRLLTAPTQCGCFSRVWPFIGHSSEYAVRVECRYFFTETADRCDSTLFASLLQGCCELR